MTLEYKGFVGSVHCSEKDNFYFGFSEINNNKIHYSGSDIRRLENNFKEEVDAAIKN